MDFESIINKHAAEDGSIPKDAVSKLAQAIAAAVGRGFVDKARYNDKLSEIETLKTEKQAAEDSAATAGTWKEKHDTLKKEFDSYKNGVTAKEAKAAKEKAARAYFESKNIKGGDLDIAMLGSAAQIDALKLKEDGSIEDTAALDGLVDGVFSRLVGAAETRTVDTAGPLNSGGAANRSTNDEMNALIRGR